MANYIYLKTSIEPVKVGDLILHLKGVFAGTYHIVTDTHQKQINIYPNDNNFVWFIPLLIMDAPELNPRLKGNLDWLLINMSSNSIIPFHSDEQVYNWFKKKGITPKDEGLYEFDGKVEICLKCKWNNECFSTGNEKIISCSECYKRAIIKEEQEESEEKLLTEVVIKCITNHEDKISISDTVKELKQHFKIERRKQ